MTAGRRREALKSTRRYQVHKGTCLVAEHVRGHPALRQLRGARERWCAPSKRRGKAVVLRALLQLRIPCKGMLRGLQAHSACGAAAVRGCKPLPRRHGCISAQQCALVDKPVASMHAT